MTSISIRIAVTSDEAAIVTIWEELSAYYQSLNPIFPIRWQRPTTTEHRLEALAKQWNDPSHYIGFVAMKDDTLVGFCRAHLTPDGPTSASIHTLVVRPQWRGEGVGKQLMGAAISWCEENGADDVALDVLPANVNAQAFHRSLGFEPFITQYVKRLR